MWISLFLALGLAAQQPDVRTHTEAALKAWAVPGAAVAVVEPDRVLHIGGYGLRELGKPDPITPHTTFQIASTTKAFTSAAVAMLVDEGRMSFDDPVRKHLDFFRLADPHADSLVTLRDLLSHRTGLPRHDTLWVRTGLSRDELLRRIGLARPTETFRAKYQYQNLMFTAAAEAVGRASGLGWDAFLAQRIFAPLGMKDSASLYSDMIRHHDMAMPHVKDKPNPWGNYDNIGGAGAIASSVHDLARWLRLQLGGGVFEGRRLISEAALAETHAPQMVNHLISPTRELQPDFTQTTYAMGWTINHYRGEMLVMHAGVLNGFRALITMVPRRKLGFVVLANQNGTNLPEALTNTLLDDYLGLEKKRDWNAHMLAVTRANEQKTEQQKRDREAARKRDTRPSLPLDAYIGLYREPAYGDVRISLLDGVLRLEWLRLKTELTHWHLDTFLAKSNEQLVQFRLNEKGAPTELRLFDQVFLRQP